ncbi:hypothetical protein CSB45_02010 [candidate division KSB3 bacterium]|uniref:Uncharacterized protein n=1 Tax=candidate division KSB3 bacterium TaxID=2044937 RepID=A0A2G6EA07_9BACT|nr:MAG: hypothetical protein CSB45_02010 [candidate division KSB3 bacterium]PIE30858.1 MAG: hypothetical protein CSA57_00620 [candidate division KSB3 bacterium]
MNIVKITNKIALVTVVLSMYWVFIFVSSTVFGFKVFRENMTEMFLLSILGLFTILSAVVLLNIMFNLTAIAERRSGEEPKKAQTISKMLVLAFIASLLALFCLLYAGDRLTSKHKENYLLSAASSLVKEQRSIIHRLADYTFSREYIERACQDIEILSKVEEEFPEVTIIVIDTIDGKPFLLGFSRYARLAKDEKVRKADYILATSSEERTYLYSALEGKISGHRFSAHDGRYEVYYPLRTDTGNIVIHLSQYSKYGKIGS